MDDSGFGDIDSVIDSMSIDELQDLRSEITETADSELDVANDAADESQDTFDFDESDRFSSDPEALQAMLDMDTSDEGDSPKVLVKRWPG